MGYNTTVVVLNDALHEIRRDPKFGEKLADAVQSMSVKDSPQDVSAGCHVNAASVIESHHADLTALVAVGGNWGRNLLTAYGQDVPVELLRQLADHLGYRVVKKSKKKEKR